jgi:hypothetical protein
MSSDPRPLLGRRDQRADLRRYLIAQLIELPQEERDRVVRALGYEVEPRRETR